MWKAFQRYRALDRESRKLFQRAAVLLALIVVSLRLRGFNKTKQSLDGLLSFGAPAKHSEHIPQALDRSCRMVSAAAHYGPVRPTCLSESLALWFLLRHQDIPASLRIGVRKTATKFEAHAWVEFDGVALNQPDEHHRHYSAFDRAFSAAPGEQP